MTDQLKRASWKEVRTRVMKRNTELDDDYKQNEVPYRFASSVIAARNNLGWSQSHLAEIIGVSQPVIARLESGERDPRLSTVAAVCRALNLPITIGGNDMIDRQVS